VKGLAFQQQDVGVAACATTAIWCSLHHFRNLEDVAAATPAQITNLAAQNNLPFGRAMPSEGLSLGQMCQAIQAVGVSPSLLKVTDYGTAKAYIFSASMSGMAPILILSEKSGRAHAVTVAGVKVDTQARPEVVKQIANISSSISSIYVHDDRVGPYGKALLEVDGAKLHLKLDPEGKPEIWDITHILVAMHPKIRLSFAGLHEAGVTLAKNIQGYFKLELGQETPVAQLETKILRGPRYIEDLMFGVGEVSPGLIEEFCRHTALPRYVGLVRISTEATGAIDVLIDTTGTYKNLHAVAVIARESASAQTAEVVAFLAEELGVRGLVSENSQT
jgi:hypothetical protein